MNNKGFTMAELLVVVAIIAVLTAVSVPFFVNQNGKENEPIDKTKNEAIEKSEQQTVEISPETNEYDRLDEGEDINISGPESASSLSPQPVVEPVAPVQPEPVQPEPELVQPEPEPEEPVQLEPIEVNGYY